MLLLVLRILLERLVSGDKRDEDSSSDEDEDEEEDDDEGEYLLE